jgi:hypothetical protein
MKKTKGYKKLPEEIRFAYYSGAQVMLSALSAASNQGLDFNESLIRVGSWLDNALLPWGRDEVGITGIRYYDGFPLPPEVYRLPEM